MKLNIISIIIGFTFFLFCACTSQEKHIARWSFDENLQTETLESVDNRYTPVQSLKKNLELVSGISGNGLRTDGYSTFLKTELSEKQTNTIGVEAWFALETYPTDTAGFFSFEQDSNNWIAGNINQFGEMMLSVCIGGKTSWHPSELHVDKFEWFNLALSVAENEARLLLNGETIAIAPIRQSQLTFSKLLIGRDSREKKIHIFPINYITFAASAWALLLTSQSRNSTVPKACSFERSLYACSLYW